MDNLFRIETLICIFVSACDAASDAIMVQYFKLYFINESPRLWTRIQWIWHILKWGSFYPALIKMTLTVFGFFEIAVIAFACFILWRLVYRLILR